MILAATIAVATLIACEIALRLPLPRLVGQLRTVPRKAAWVMRSDRISDTWKEKAVPAYSVRLLRASLTFFACLIAIAAPVVILVALVTGSMAEASATLIRPLPLLEMIAIGAGYIWLRRRA